MCLRFVFLVIMRVAAGLRLSGREEMWKTAEILILRHQLSVLQCRQPRRPKLDWADRALLAALLGVIPKARRRGLRLLVTPDTIVRWHRDIFRRRWEARSAPGKTGRRNPAEHQGPGPSASPREPRLGIPEDPRRDGWPGRQRRSIDRGRSSRPAASARPGRADRTGRSSCGPRPRRSWHATSPRPTCSMAPRPMSWP